MLGDRLAARGLRISVGGLVLLVRHVARLRGFVRRVSTLPFRTRIFAPDRLRGNLLLTRLTGIPLVEFAANLRICSDRIPGKIVVRGEPLAEKTRAGSACKNRYTISRNFASTKTPDQETETRKARRNLGLLLLRLFRR